jgi:hypothetical protein
MDVAYDHIQEEILSPDEQRGEDRNAQHSTLNTEFQEAYKAFSSSPWGAKIGGFWGSVVKQVSHMLQSAIVVLNLRQC